MSEDEDQNPDAEEMLEAHQELEEKIVEDKGRVYKFITTFLFIVLWLLVFWLLFGLFGIPQPGVRKMEY